MLFIIGNLARLGLGVVPDLKHLNFFLTIENSIGDGDGDGDDDDKD